jgi:hypothetical protein
MPIWVVATISDLYKKKLTKEEKKVCVQHKLKINISGGWSITAVTIFSCMIQLPCSQLVTLNIIGFARFVGFCRILLLALLAL